MGRIFKELPVSLKLAVADSDLPLPRLFAGERASP